MNKGPGKPIFDIDQRVELLKSINIIDEVVISKNKTAVEIIKKIKPDFYIKVATIKTLILILQIKLKQKKKQ